MEAAKETGFANSGRFPIAGIEFDIVRRRPIQVAAATDAVSQVWAPSYDLSGCSEKTAGLMRPESAVDTLMIE